MVFLPKAAGRLRRFVVSLSEERLYHLPTDSFWVFWLGAKIMFTQRKFSKRILALSVIALVMFYYGLRFYLGQSGLNHTSKQENFFEMSIEELMEVRIVASGSR